MVSLTHSGVRGKKKSKQHRKEIRKDLRDFPSGPVVKTFNAGGVGSIPSWGAKIPHALQSKNQNIKQKQYCNKFNKGF